MKVRGEGVLGFLSLHNPFYLLSALTMLAGCFLIINPWGQGGRRLGDLFISWGVLGVYEAAVIVMAVILHRKMKARRDVGKLVFVSLLFIFDCVFLADAFAISGGRHWLVLVGAMTLFAGVKLAALLIGLKVRLNIDSLVFTGLSLAIVFAAPIVITAYIHADLDCRAGLLNLWLAFTGLVFLFAAWRYARGLKWSSGSSGKFWYRLCLMGFVMGAAHLFSVGLELQGGFSIWLVTPFLCTFPLVVRVFFPVLCRSRKNRNVIDLGCISSVLTVVSIVMMTRPDYIVPAAFALSFRMTFVAAAAVYGLIILKERRSVPLVYGGVIAFLALLFSRPAGNFLPVRGVVAVSAGLAGFFIFAILFGRYRTRLFLSILTVSSYLMLAGLMTGFGLGSVFAFVQWTGLTLILFEFVVWDDSLPFYRNAVAGFLLVYAATFVYLDYGVFSCLFYCVEVASFLAIGLVLHRRSLTLVSSAGILPLMTILRPATLRGWGVALAAAAACMLTFGFWLSVRYRKGEPRSESPVSET